MKKVYDSPGKPNIFCIKVDMKKVYDSFRNATLLVIEIYIFKKKNLVFKKLNLITYGGTIECVVP